MSDCRNSATPPPLIRGDKGGSKGLRLGANARSRMTQAGLLRRCFLVLALAPIVPSTSCVAEQVIESRFPGQDDIWLNQLLFSVFLMTALIAIIRATVIWYFGRVGLTALISMIPFVQVIINKPLWNAGCIVDDLLRTGQHQFGCGLWIWLSVWVWWGWEKRAMKIEETSKVRTASPGSIFFSGLTASIGLIPIVFGIWLVSMTYIDRVLGINNYAIIIFWCYLACALFALLAWLLIWRRIVKWSSRTRWLTFASWMLLVAIPIACQFLVAGTTPQPWQIMLQVLPLIGWGIWMAATGWIWPMRVMSSAQEGPHCPQCQYPLTGLTHTRCPECGTEPTLDALWAATSGSIVS